MTCLRSYPSDTPLGERCPRCNGEAGDHPAPIALMADPNSPIINRPTLREALRDLEMRQERMFKVGELGQ